MARHDARVHPGACRRRSAGGSTCRARSIPTRPGIFELRIEGDGCAIVRATCAGARRSSQYEESVWRLGQGLPHRVGAYRDIHHALAPRRPRSAGGDGRSGLENCDGGRSRRAQAALGGAARRARRGRLMRALRRPARTPRLHPGAQRQAAAARRLSRGRRPTPTAAGASPRSPATSRSTRSSRRCCAR